MGGKPRTKTRRQYERTLANVRAKQQEEIDKARIKIGKKPQQEDFQQALESALLSDSYVGEIRNLWVTRPERIFCDEKVPEHLIVLAVRRMHGIKAAVARVFGVDRTVVEGWAVTMPAVAQAFVTERESIVDLAEARLYESIAGGAPWAVDMALKTLGKDRGYTLEYKAKSNKGTILSVIDSAATGEVKPC